MMQRTAKIFCAVLLSKPNRQRRLPRLSDVTRLDESIIQSNIAVSLTYTSPFPFIQEDTDRPEPASSETAHTSENSGHVATHERSTVTK